MSTMKECFRGCCVVLSGLLASIGGEPMTVGGVPLPCGDRDCCISRMKDRSRSVGLAPYRGEAAWLVVAAVGWMGWYPGGSAWRLVVASTEHARAMNGFRGNMRQFSMKRDQNPG